MEIVQAKATLEEEIDAATIFQSLERWGRICYKSEDKITDESSIKFVAMLLKSGHESVIEHEKITVRIVCDRGVTHEIVRHRLCSYSQESTRYCNYKSRGIKVIQPQFTGPNAAECRGVWKDAMEDAERAYLRLIDLGEKPQIARSVLPNSLKTEIIVTANLREWRHIFKLRTSAKAHPQMREVMIPLLKEFQDKLGVLFNDIRPSE